MIVLADTHVHLYPGYDFSRAIFSACENLDRAFAQISSLKPELLTEPRTYLLYLTERDGVAGFERYPELLGALHSGDEIELLTESPGALQLRIHKKFNLFLISGSQIVTSERVEVLGLCLTQTVSNGMSASDTIAEIIKHGGVPILPWSPGKWSGERGRVVENLLARVSPKQLILGDIYMRPAFTPEPVIFQRWKLNGGKVVGGSDSLPLIGEDRIIGSYGMWCQFPFNSQSPLQSAKELLHAEKLNSIGMRSGWPQTIARQLRLKFGKKLP